MATRDLPSLDLLKGFESAARHLSFTRAGAELFLTQSAISRQVQALEVQLGVQLFQRKTRALLLTDEGQRFFKAVREALDDLRAATAAVRTGKAGAALTVATTVTFASLWLVPRLTQFQAAHPGIQVRLVADNRIQDLERERIDVAVRYCPPGMAGSGAVRLFGVRVLPVTSPEVARAARLARPEDLARCTLLEYDDAERTPWLTWRVWFETLRIPLLQGRDFGPDDRSGLPPVAIVNDALARELGPPGKALGQPVRVTGFVRFKLGETAGE